MPDGLDARALRALGKALSFTENVGDEELQRAFDRLVAENEITEAAVAAIDLSQVRWRHGDGTAAADWVARALELAAGVEPDHEHAYVMANAARYEMVAGNPDEAIRLADRAIALAEEFDTPRVSAAALVSRATAMANTGAYGPALDDLRHAIVLTRENPFELTRAHVNLGSVLLDLGEIERGDRGRARGGRRVRANGHDRRVRTVRPRQPRRGALPCRSVGRGGDARGRRSRACRADRRAVPRAALRVRGGRARARPRRSCERCGGQRPPRGRPRP